MMIMLFLSWKAILGVYAGAVQFVMFSGHGHGAPPGRTLDVRDQANHFAYLVMKQQSDHVKDQIP